MPRVSPEELSGISESELEPIAAPPPPPEPPGPLTRNNRNGTVAQNARRFLRTGIPSRPNPRGKSGGVAKIDGKVPTREIEGEVNRRPTLGERAISGAASLSAGSLDLLHSATVGTGKLLYRLGSVPQRTVAGMGAGVGSMLSGESVEEQDREFSNAFHGRGPYTPAPNLDEHPIFNSPGDETYRRIRDTGLVRPGVDTDAQDEALRIAPTLAVVAGASPSMMRSGSPLPKASPPVPVEKLPEVESFARAAGSGEVPERGVYASRGRARAGITFDPKDPLKFVDDHKQAIKHTQLAREQLLADSNASTPSIATTVAIDEINRAAASTSMRANEIEAVNTLTRNLSSRGDLVSARDLHNAVEQLSGNIPSGVRRAITPMIDGDAPGYGELGQHMGDLVEGEKNAVEIAKRLRSTSGKGANRVLAGVRAVGRMSRGDVTGAVSNAVDAAGGGAEVLPIDVKTLAKTSRAAAKAAKLHAEAAGLPGPNPTLNALQRIVQTAPESSAVEGAGASPRTFAGQEEGTPFEVTDPRVTPGNTFDTAGPGVRGFEVNANRGRNPLPTLSTPSEPSPTEWESRPTFAGRDQGAPIPLDDPRTSPINTFGPMGPSALDTTPHPQVPPAPLVRRALPPYIEEPAATTPTATEVPVRSPKKVPDRSDLFTAEPSDRFATQSGAPRMRSFEVPKRVFRSEGGKTSEVPVDEWVKNQSPADQPIDRTFSKGETIKYTQGDQTFRGKIISDVKQSKHGPYVDVMSLPDRGQRSILVSNIKRIGGVAGALEPK